MAEGSLVLAEFLPVINSCNFFINFGGSEKISEINVMQDAVKVCYDQGKIYYKYNLPKGVFFKSNFLSGVQRETDWITFRVQLDEKTRIVNSVYCDIAGDLLNLQLNSHFSPIEKCLLNSSDSLYIHCKGCNLQVTNMGMKLEKVSQFPSLDWDCSSETWFCHVHDTHLHPLKKTSMIPKHNECFYDDLSCYIAADLIREPTKDKFPIICQQCCAKIGHMNKNVAQLWLTEIKWLNNSDLVYSISEKETFINLFQNLEKDSIGAAVRLVLQSDSKPQKFIFLITMDSNLTLLVTKKCQMLLDNTSSLDFSPPKQKPKIDIETVNMELNKITVIKLLFRIKVGEDDESGSWFDDVNVHILPCGESFFQTIYSSLLASNQCLPDSLTNVNNMKVGYIMKGK